MTNKNSKYGILLLLAVVLGIYAGKEGFAGGDEPEQAEEAALGHISGGSVDLQDEVDTAPAELYAQVSATAPMELPVGGLNHGILIEHTGYTLSYDTVNHNPFWVAWQLTASESRGREERADEFVQDPQLPERHAVRESSYRGTGYTRGHMCPAGDQKWSEDAMHDSFYMSNMCPQTRELNKDWWDMLERKEREWARKEGSVYIVCGPVYESGRKVKSLRKGFFIGIPHAFFKVILSTRKGHEKAIGFIYRNDASEQLMEQTACSVDEVERLTHYDFFAPLEDGLEERLESRFDLSSWN